MKRILITGKNSYIGKSFQAWLAQYPEEYEVEAISVRGDDWKEKDFSKYDVVYHVAGIAHIKETKKNESLYYKINRDLAVVVAEKSKREGVKQFIFLSSMSVYGLSEGIITRKTQFQPKNAYGKSKLEAENKILKLGDDNFVISIIRPPMVYGENCNGNYLILSQFAKKSMIFPDIKNKRSMIYVRNLSYCIQHVIDNELVGIFCPQNTEFICTSKLVKKISEVNGKKILLLQPLKNLNFMISNFKIVKKIFGDLYYDFRDFDNLPISFEQSIILTEEKI